MLEYAYKKSDIDKELLFIDDKEVLNGKKCGCICPHCKDDLIANNGGEIKRHYFSHQNKVEGRDCLMTQLHLVAQHYFENLLEFHIPDVSFIYDSHELKKSGKASRVISSKMEQRIGRYFSDVLINTQDGPFSIEICVTHPCEDEKVLHYTNIKLPTIEYDLSNLRSLDIQDAIKLLKTNSVECKWLYPWDRDQMISAWKKRLAQRKKLYLDNQIRKANASAKEIVDTKNVLLPSLDEEIIFYNNDVEYKKDISIVKSKFYALDEVIVHSQEDDCLILKGHKAKRSKNKVLWIVYLYHGTTPSVVQKLKGSVIIRRPMIGIMPEEEWYWYSNDTLIARLEAARQELKLSFYATAKADVDINDMVAQFIKDKDVLFSGSYKTWSNWMIAKQLFQPSLENKNVKIPRVLKGNGSASFFWVFNVWPVLLWSKLAEVIDDFSDSKIDYLDLLRKFNTEFSFREEFINVESLIDSSISHTKPHLYNRKEIIKQALKPYESQGLVELDDEYVYRKYSLLSSLRM